MFSKIAKAARTLPGITALVAATALGGVGTAYALAGDEGVVTIKQESFEPTPTPPPVEPTVAPEPVASEVPAPVPEEITVSPKPAPEPVAASEPAAPEPESGGSSKRFDGVHYPPMEGGNGRTGTWAGDEKTND